MKGDAMNRASTSENGLGGICGKKNIMLNKKSLGFIVRYFKGKTKYLINKAERNHFSRQPNYYERIIRNEKELNKIRNYIINNPLKRELEKDNVENVFM